jgi:uncharacterized membrane protein YsdA (DUF1294 family)
MARQHPDSQKSRNNNPRADHQRAQAARRRPHGWFALIAFGLAGLVMFALSSYSDSTTFDGIDLWLIAINLITFVIYAYDKSIAKTQLTRVPESLLLLLALVGGTIGALAAMQLLRHKTAKAGFRLKFWLVVIVQIVLISVGYGLMRSSL